MWLEKPIYKTYGTPAFSPRATKQTNQNSQVNFWPEPKSSRRIGKIHRNALRSTTSTSRYAAFKMNLRISAIGAD